MGKLVVDSIKCDLTTDSSDDLYLIVGRHTKANFNAWRVGPDASWHDIHKNNLLNNDVTVDSPVSEGATYFVALMEQDANIDFDLQSFRWMMNLYHQIYSSLLTQFGPGSLQGQMEFMVRMFGAFFSTAQSCRGDDDILGTQICAPGKYEFFGEGARYSITFKVI